MYIYIAGCRLEKKVEFNLNIDFLFNFSYENRERFKILGTIDPYGITYFNCIQVKFLIIDELEAILKVIIEKKNEISIFLDFINTIEQHDFLVVIGD